MPNTDYTITEADEYSFSELLQKLKQRGCSILVCGLISYDKIDYLSAQLIENTTSSAAQTRLFGLIDQDVDSIQSRLELLETDKGITRVVDIQTCTRSSASSITPSTKPFTVRTISNNIDEFESEICHEISKFDLSDKDYESRDLCVCIDSLSPFLAKYNKARVEQFLDKIDQMALSTESIIHTILPMKYNSPIINRIIPFFDIIISLRHPPKEGIQQQWYIPLSGHKTDWISFEETQVYIDK